MKIQYLLIVFILISCTQNTKKKKEPVKVQDTVELVIDPPKKVDAVSFNELLEELRSKTIPLIDSTNFDTFIEERKIYNKEEVLILQLEKIYPNYYKEGYNYRATPNYKMKLSKKFHSAVITIYKGDHEMESVLINYDLKGKIIDFKIISYDEIAEGWSRIESEIEKNKLTVKNILWAEEKQVEIELFEINPSGKITPLINTDNSELTNSKESLSIQELMLLTKLKAIEKYDTPSSLEQFILDDAQGEFRNGISNKYSEKERQSESILIDEITWEKDKNTWITVWYESKQEESVPKDVYEWKKGTEF